MINDATEKLRQKLDEKRAALISARERVEALEIEVRAWEEAVRLLGSHVDDSWNAVALRARHDNGDKPTRRRRKLSPQWHRTLSKLFAEKGFHEWSFDEVESIASDLGFDIQRPTIRSQISIYVSRGWIERVEMGAYRFSQKGLSDLKLEDGSGKQSSAGSVRGMEASSRVQPSEMKPREPWETIGPRGENQRHFVTTSDRSHRAGSSPGTKDVDDVTRSTDRGNFVKGDDAE